MLATCARWASSVNRAGRAAIARPSTVKASAVPLRSVIAPRCGEQADRPGALGLALRRVPGRVDGLDHDQLAAGDREHGQQHDQRDLAALARVADRGPAAADPAAADRRLPRAWAAGRAGRAARGRALVAGRGGRPRRTAAAGRCAVAGCRSGAVRSGRPTEPVGCGAGPQCRSVRLAVAAGSRRCPGCTATAARASRSARPRSLLCSLRPGGVGIHRMRLPAAAAAVVRRGLGGCRVGRGLARRRCAASACACASAGWAPPAACGGCGCVDAAAGSAACGCRRIAGGGCRIAAAGCGRGRCAQLRRLPASAAAALRRPRPAAAAVDRGDRRHRIRARRDGSPMTDPVPEPSTINIAESPAGTMPSPRPRRRFRRGVQQRDVPLQRLDRQPQVGGLALGGRGVRMPASSVTVFRYSTPAIPPAEQRDQHHDERRPVQRGLHRLARADQPARGDLLRAPLPALVGPAGRRGRRRAPNPPSTRRPTRLTAAPDGSRSPR